MRRLLSRVALGLLPLALMAGCSDSSAAPVKPSIAPSDPFTEVRRVTLGGPGGASRGLWAWVADTPQKRSRGLMHRTALPDDAGMLFVFPREHRGGFWMKNTRIPLSIAYIGADLRILRIMHMAPCRQDPCRVYDPAVPYRYALEVNRGWFQSAGVRRGWRLASDGG